jgi:hypothetical protein
MTVANNYADRFGGFKPTRDSTTTAVSNACMLLTLTTGECHDTPNDDI